MRYEIDDNSDVCVCDHIYQIHRAGGKECVGRDCHGEACDCMKFTEDKESW